MTRPAGAALLADLGPRDVVPRLEPTVDWTKVAIDGDQGFVLSRVDGHTSLGQIVALVPFPEARIVEILRGLHEQAVIDIPGRARGVKVAAAVPATVTLPRTAVAQPAKAEVPRTVTLPRTAVARPTSA